MDEYTPFESFDTQHQQLNRSMDELINGPDSSAAVTSIEGELSVFEAPSSQFPADLPPSSFSLDEILGPETPTRPPGVPREEPETIRRWREEMLRHLEEKDALEEVKKEELRENAQRELAEWYARYNESVAKCRAANRSTVMGDWARDTPADRTPEWENIARLCDFNAKAARNAKDVSRMRAIILQLKQQSPTHHGALGGVLSPAISM